jgi:CubicO group peptidase (beta-lactamase class C family)
MIPTLAAALLLAAWPPEASPASQGMDARALESLDAEFARGDHGFVDSMLVLRNGKLVFERAYRHDYAARFDPKRDGAPGLYNYYDPRWHPFWQGGPLHTLQSVSKSVTSLLVGIAIGRGQISGVEAPALEYLKAFRPSGDPRQARMRLAHVLSMTAGIRWDEDSVPYTDPANSCANMEASGDWIQFVLDQPMAEEPGRSFRYNSGATQLLAGVLRQATGQQADEYARELLFAPLGIERFEWKRANGVTDTEGGLYLAPRDLARIGVLLQQDGVWEGRRVLPEGWVRESTTERIRANDSDDPKHAYAYGYKWWLIPPSEARPGAVVALGYGGQRLIVVPERALVAVFTGWNIWERPALSAHFALDRLLAATAKGAGAP